MLQIWGKKILDLRGRKVQKKKNWGDIYLEVSRDEIIRSQNSTETHYVKMFFQNKIR